MLISVIFSTIYHNIQQIIEACVEPLVEMYSHWKFFLQFVIFSRIRPKKAVCWKLSLFFPLNSASISQWKTPYAALRSSIVNMTKLYQNISFFAAGTSHDHVQELAFVQVM